MGVGTAWDKDMEQQEGVLGKGEYIIKVQQYMCTTMSHTHMFQVY